MQVGKFKWPHKDPIYGTVCILCFANYFNKQNR